MKKYIPILLISSCTLVACQSSEQVTGEGASSLNFLQTAGSVRNNPTQWSDEAALLARYDQEEDTYLEQIGLILANYVQITKETGYPSGLNYEITNKLLGENAQKVALIDISHPKINGAGELIDGWGTPYHFHSETSSDISIQSAGPDLVQYTDDDIVYEALNSLSELVVLAPSDSEDDVTSNASVASLQTDFVIKNTPSAFDGFESGELLAN